MKKFRFQLEGYLKVKKAFEQKKLGELAKVVRKANVFREQQQNFDDEYSARLKAQRVKFTQQATPVTELRDTYDYLAALRRRKEVATKQIVDLEPEMAARRNEYNAARKERRVIEILREKRVHEHRQQTEKEEVAFLDEFNQSKRGNL
jgi:flagellar protein FliJ